jgi:hypothetical protein
MAEARVALGQMTLLRASYFTRRQLPGPGPGDVPSGPVILREPTLEDAEQAFAQMRLLLRYAALLSEQRLYGAGGMIRLEPGFSPEAARVRAISMGSLELVLELALLASATGLALLRLARGICTFRPRVSAERQEALLKADRARSERQRLAEETAAHPLVKLLRDTGPSRHETERGPDHIDLVADERDEVVEWNPVELDPPHERQ